MIECDAGISSTIEGRRRRAQHAQSMRLCPKEWHAGGGRHHSADLGKRSLEFGYRTRALRSGRIHSDSERPLETARPDLMCVGRRRFKSAFCARSNFSAHFGPTERFLSERACGDRLRSCRARIRLLRGRPAYLLGLLGVRVNHPYRFNLSQCMLRDGYTMQVGQQCGHAWFWVQLKEGGCATTRY
jgi:hypothetical protein